MKLLELIVYFNLKKKNSQARRTTRGNTACGCISCDYAFRTRQGWGTYKRGANKDQSG